MLLTRPNIAFLVQWLSIALAKPFIEHLNASKHLLRYLLGSMGYSITYRRSKSTIIAFTTLISFCDSDFAGDKSSKLTYAYLYKLAKGPISQKLKKATTIALFTLEAKSNALCEAIRELEWLYSLFKEIKLPIAPLVLIFSNN